LALPTYAAPAVLPGQRQTPGAMTAAPGGGPMVAVGAGGDVGCGVDVGGRGVDVGAGGRVGVAVRALVAVDVGRRVLVGVGGTAVAVGVDDGRAVAVLVGGMVEVDVGSAVTLGVLEGRGVAVGLDVAESVSMVSSMERSAGASLERPRLAAPNMTQQRHSSTPAMPAMMAMMAGRRLRGFLAIIRLSVGSICR